MAWGPMSFAQMENLGEVPVGDDAVIDLSGNGNHLRTFSRTTSPNYVSDVPFDTVPQTGQANNRALRFTPAQDIYTSGKPLNDYEFDAWTIEVSFKANSPGVGDQGILGKDGDPLDGHTSPVSIRMLEDYDGELEVGLVDGAGNQIWAYTDAPLAGEWYSVAVTATSKQLALYVKGPGDTEYENRHTVPISGAFAGPAFYENINGQAFSRTWTVGRGMWAGQFIHFDGLIDEVRISDAALSPSEFLGVEGNGGEVLPSTLAYWRFEEQGVILDHHWIADTGDFMEPGNWASGEVPGAGHTAIVSNGGTAQLTTAGSHSLGELWPGREGSGSVEISGGGTITNTGWLRVGVDSGSGNAGELSLSGEGTILENVEGGNTRIGDGAPGSTGILTIEEGATLNHSSSGNFWVGGSDPTNHGTLNLNGGTLNKTNGLNLILGDFGTGILNHFSGALTMTSGDFWVGAAGGSGTYHFHGGTLDLTVPMAVGVNEGTGVMNMDGGTLNTTGQFWLGQASGSTTGASTGTLNLSGGEFNISHWFVLGRQNGTGSLLMTGGTINHTGAADQRFRVGAPGAGQGTFTQTSGVVNVHNAPLDIAAGGTSEGEVTLSGDAELNILQGLVELASAEGNTAVLNLDGGTLQTAGIVGGNGLSTVRLNGTLIRATRNRIGFIDNISNLDIGPGGFLLDSEGYDLVVNQAMSGAGGVTKTGAGSLRLVGANDYSGPTAVEEGLLALGSHSTLSGDVTVANGATLAVQVIEGDVQLTLDSLVLGDSSVIQLDFGEMADVQASPLFIGSLTMNGAVVVNVTGGPLEVGSIPLVQYGSRSGTGSFVLGTVPPGVAADLTVENGQLSLSVNRSISLAWDGTESGRWQSGGEANWIDVVTGDPAPYTDGVPVLFDDRATGTTAIMLDATVSPARISFDHGDAGEGAVETYSISGSGSIAGDIGLTKYGSGTLILDTANTYTGATRIHGGTLSVSDVSNAGEPGPLGASGADPENLLLNAGTLHFSGSGTAFTDRGFTIGQGQNVVEVDDGAHLTVGGAVAVGAAGNRRLRKVGPGTLTLSFPGENILGASSAQPATEVSGGTLILQGGENHASLVDGFLWVGEGEGSTGKVNLNSGELTVNGTLVVGRNGGTGSIEMTDGILNVGVTTIIGNQAGGNGSFTQSGGLANYAGEFWVANEGSTGAYQLSGGTIQAGGFFVIGRGGPGTFEMTGGTIRHTSPDQHFNVGPRGGFTSTFDQSGGEVVVESANLRAGLFGTTAGIITLSDDAEFRLDQGRVELAIEANTQGTLNLNGGVLKTAQITGGNGASTVNFNGGEVIATTDTEDFLVGLTNVALQSGGLNLNTGSFDLTISRDLPGPGPVTVSGNGSLSLNGELPDASGVSVVDEATLAGVGVIGATVAVGPDAALAPGGIGGTLTVGGAGIDGTLRIRFDGTGSTFLDAGGELSIANATLEIAAPGQDLLLGEPYPIADYGNLVGEFAKVVLPAGFGYSIDYDYQGQGRIAITFEAGSLDGIEEWRLAHFGTADNEGAAANEADPDGDGLANLLEYALGTDPLLAGGLGDPEGEGGVRFGREGDFLTLTFSHIGDPSLRFHIEATDQLDATWKIARTFTFAEEGVTTYEDDEPVTTHPRRFLRLRVESGGD